MSIVKFKISGIEAYRLRRQFTSNPNNAHENASAFANNIPNQVVEDRNGCGRTKLEFIPHVYSQRSCRGIRAAIVPVTWECCRRTGKRVMFYLLFSHSPSL
jgi:hypothetical protein